MKSTDGTEMQNFLELLSIINAGDHNKFVESFERYKPSNTSNFLRGAITSYNNPDGAPENKSGQKEIAEFLFRSYVDSALSEDPAVWQQKDYSTGEVSNFSFSTVAGYISHYLNAPNLDLKQSLDDEKLEAVLKVTESERQKVIDSPSTPHEHGYSQKAQLAIIDHLKDQVGGILTERKVTGLLSDVDSVFKEILEGPKSSDDNQNAEIENIKNLLENTEISNENKAIQLKKPLLELANLDPKLGQKLGEILGKIGKLVGAASSVSDESNREVTSKPSEIPQLPDVTGNEDSLKLKTDVLTDEEAQKRMAESPEETAARLLREEEEKKKLADQNSASANNIYNHHSTSKDLDPNIAAAGLKMAGVLAIALGIGGPAGLILAGLFLIATKNIANGKEVTHINSGNQGQNAESEVGDAFLKHMMQSAQAAQSRTAPVNMAASTGPTLEDMQEGMTLQEQALKNSKAKIVATNAKQPEVRARTDENIEAALGADNSPRSNSNDGSQR